MAWEDCRAADDNELPSGSFSSPDGKGKHSKKGGRHNSASTRHGSGTSKSTFSTEQGERNARKAVADQALRDAQDRNRGGGRGVGETGGPPTGGPSKGNGSFF